VIVSGRAIDTSLPDYRELDPLFEPSETTSYPAATSSG